MDMAEESIDYLSATAGFGVSYGLGKESFAHAYFHRALLFTMTRARDENRELHRKN